MTVKSGWMKQGLLAAIVMCCVPGVDAALRSETAVTNVYDANGNITSQTAVVTANEFSSTGTAVTRTYTTRVLTHYTAANTTGLKWFLGLPDCRLQADQVTGQEAVSGLSAAASDTLAIRSETYSYLSHGVMDTDISTMANYAGTPQIPDIWQLDAKISGVIAAAANTVVPAACTAPDDDWSVKTQYTYNNFGLITGTTLTPVNAQSDRAFPARTVQWDYKIDSGTEGDYRFPLWVIRTPEAGVTLSERVLRDSWTGKPTRQTDANGVVTTWEYDAAGRVVKEVRPDGAQTEYAYAPGNPGVVITITDKDASLQAIGYPKTTGVDRFGRAVASLSNIVSPEQTAYAYQNTAYDVMGRIASTTEPGFLSSIEGGAGILETNTLTETRVYDALGRLQQIKQKPIVTSTNFTAIPASTTTLPAVEETMATMTYVNPLSVKVKNVLSQENTTTRDLRGNVVSVVNAEGQRLRYIYDISGNLRQTIDPKGNKITLEYDPLGHKKAMSDPDLGNWSYINNLLGELTTQTDARGKITSLKYDGLGRIKEKTTEDQIAYWTYDTGNRAKGKVSRHWTSTGVDREYRYDNIGRPEAEITAVAVDNGTAVTRFEQRLSYDLAGRPDQVVFPTGNGYRNIYGSDGLLYEVRDLNSNVLYWRAGPRSVLGTPKIEYLGNGLQVRRSLDARRHLNTLSTGRVLNGVFSPTVQNDAYTFDALGNLGLRIEALHNLTESFGYDSLNRLKQVVLGDGTVQQALSYDAIGNIQSRSDAGTYGYNASGENSYQPHAVRRMSGDTVNDFNYDANGNMTDGMDRVWTWNADNTPREITRVNVREGFQYDGEQNRIKRRSFENQNGSFVDAGELLSLNPQLDLGGTYERERKADGSVEHNQYIYADGRAIAMLVQPESTRYYKRFELSNELAADFGFVESADAVDPHNVVDWVGGNGSGRIALYTRPAAAFSNPKVSQPVNERVSAGAGFIYRTEVTLTANVNGASNRGRYAIAAVMNGGQATSTLRRHGAYFRGGSLYVLYNDGVVDSATGNYPTRTLNLNFALEDNAVYVVEVVTHTGGSTLYVYRKGMPLTSGVSHTVNFDSANTWGTAGWVFWGLADVNEGVNVCYIDNPSITSVSGTEVRYLHSDHLGSIVGVSNSVGEVLEHYSYDAFGRRRALAGGDSAAYGAPTWTLPDTVEPVAEVNGSGLKLNTIFDQTGKPPLIGWEDSPQGGKRLAFYTREAYPVYSSNPLASAVPEVRLQESLQLGAAKHARLSFEVTTGGALQGRGRFLRAGLANTGSSTGASPGFRAYVVYFRGAKAYVVYADGTLTADGKVLSKVEPLIESVLDNTTYVVEIDSSSNTSRLCVYPKSSSCGAGGFRHSAVMDWTGGQGVSSGLKKLFQAYSYAGVGEGVNVTYVDEVSLRPFVPVVALDADFTRRGYTGHESLGRLGLVHMNGRVFDPAVGRFASADPFVDGALNLQGYNRYSYVHNNPLSAVDPSGFTFTLVPANYELPGFDKVPDLTPDYDVNDIITPGYRPPSIIPGYNSPIRVSINPGSDSSDGGAAQTQKPVLSIQLAFNGENLAGLYAGYNSGSVVSMADVIKNSGIGSMSGLNLNTHGSPGTPALFNNPDVALAVGMCFVLPELCFGVMRNGVANSGVPRAVIGRMEDLRAPTALRPGEYTIADKLPNLGNPEANYYQNMSVLRDEMRRGIPIRDASNFRPDAELAPTPLWPDRTIRQTFTGAERNQLSNKGWNFDGEYWNPPK